MASPERSAWREAALLAGEEFSALTFIGPHGYYRQAFGCRHGTPLRCWRSVQA